MKQSIDIVNTARATYQYMVSEERELVTCEVSGTAINTMELEQDYKIENHVSVCRVMAGDTFEYTLKISNTGDTKDMVFVMDQFAKELQVLDITIDTQQYPYLDQIYYGILIGTVEPDRPVTVRIRVKMTENQDKDSLQMMSCNCTNQLANKAFIYMKDCKDRPVFFESNEVCIPVVKRYFYPYNFRICVRSIPKGMRQICSITQKLCSYIIYEYKNAIVVEGCLEIFMTYWDCCGRKKNQIIHSPVKCCIPLEHNSSDLCPNDISVSEFTILCWNYCYGRLIICEKAMICSIR